MILVFGCAGRNFSTVAYYIKGEYYLQSDGAGRGIAYFNRILEKSPDDPWANYYLGRFLLIEKQEINALERLKKAVQFNPDNADFHFWLGVAYAANKDFKEERTGYEKALVLKPKHLQALIYLGHNLFNAENFQSALINYNAAIKLWPECPDALYNKAKILNKIGRTQEEKEAWLTYLEYYSTGAFARNAVRYLNNLGDFTYRNFLIGHKTLTIKKITFDKNQKPETASGMHLSRIARLLKAGEKTSVHMIVYHKGNITLAHEKAKNIKSYLIVQYSGISPEQIKLSWFDTPEKINLNNKIFELKESVKFVTLL